MLLGSACTKEWLQDYTADPARPLEVSVKVLLPSAQVSYTMAQGDALPRLTSIFLQQMTGADRQSLAHNRYAQIGEADFDVVWADNGYAGGMKDLQLIIEATEGTSPRYCGIARIMMAQYLGMFTDIWGDIPYGNALKGADDYNPTYVSQQQIYTTIEEMLTTAITELGQPVGALAPGSAGSASARNARRVPSVREPAAKLNRVAALGPGKRRRPAAQRRRAAARAGRAGDERRPPARLRR